MLGYFYTLTILERGFFSENMESIRSIQGGRVSEYPATQRIKSAMWGHPVTSKTALREMQGIWTSASQRFDTPLAQVRCILPTSEQQNILEAMGKFHQNISRDNSHASVVAKIPFVIEGEEYAIYYLQAESGDRPSYPLERGYTHEQAVDHGLSRRGVKRSLLSEGFSLHAVEFVNTEGKDIFTQRPLPVSMTTLAEQLADVHRQSFAYPHDKAQQTSEGVQEILTHNPIMYITDPEGVIAAVGFLEQDTDFALGGGALIEPTYFTSPDERYRRHGLSSHLRQAVQQLALQPESFTAYGERPLVIFNESVRETSFPLCLANGYHLSGDAQIPGNLGRAYVAIGPANPQTGFMSMGSTYFRSPQLGVQHP